MYCSSRVIQSAGRSVEKNAYKTCSNYSIKCRLPLCLFRRVHCRNLTTNDTYRPPTEGFQFTSKSRDPKWDHVFSTIPTNPPQIPQVHPSVHPGVGPRRPRRQTMTTQELNAFNEIFNMIFDSMGEDAKGSSAPVSVGRDGTGMGEMFGTLRRHSKRMKWTSEWDEELDRKKDEMDRCASDQQLLDWAMREVFAESIRYEAEFRKAREMDNQDEWPMLQPPTYPHIIALLVRTFRDKYRDPHLALSMFDYAQHLSSASYAIGCSTAAYNELITTRWNYFRDLKGVRDAIEEMLVNGVDMDNKTRELAEKVRLEVRARNQWIEEDESGTEEVRVMLDNIHKLVSVAVANDPKPKRQKSKHKGEKSQWNDWKYSEGVHDTVDPTWEFDKW